jgi:hypothetical protein
MQQLTNEEITRVFAMYMPCEFMYEEEINNLVAVGNGWIYSDEADESGEGVFGTEDCKLLLTPLSAITDEHAVELVEIINGEKILEKTKVIIEEGIIKIYWSEILHESHKDYGYRYTATIYPDLFTTTKEYGTTIKMDYEAYRHLIQQGYSVPLFFGINHWANGKTAIELKIATDKTLAK